MPVLSRRLLLLSVLGGSLAGCDKPARPLSRRGVIGSAVELAKASFPEPELSLEPSADPFEVDEELFARKGSPESGDWLAHHAESYQSYRAYVALGPVRATRSRSRIVLQPLGGLSKRGKALLRAVREHAACFFTLEVDVAPPLPLPTAGRRPRTEGGFPWQQHHTGTLLKELAKKLPKDAVAYLGVTEADLYPQASWNFVFGEATLDEHVGVYSFARFLPPFASARSAEDTARAVRRSVQLLAHETGHVFSLPHCVRFACLMNGSNSLAETDRAPVELCPDCLKKLAFALRFDPVARYVALRDFFTTFGLTSEAAWISRRLEHLSRSRG